MIDRKILKRSIQNRDIKFKSRQLNQKDIKFDLQLGLQVFFLAWG